MSLAAVLAGTQAWHVETADVLAGLRLLPDGCVQTVVTSPPYMGLRAYSTTPQVWGGAVGCAHQWADQRVARPNGHGGPSEKQESNGGSWPVDYHDRATYAATCTRCGAWRGELGSEPTPALFVAHLVAVLRELRRVLRDDGTVWLNVGDSYAGAGHNGGQASINGEGRKALLHRYGSTPTGNGIPAKSLCLIPERLALALQDDGWILRSHIVWSKLAPMPESVTDRPTSAWEHVFLLTKRGKYFYDAEAVRQPHTDPRVVNGQYTGTGGRSAAEYEPHNQGWASADGGGIVMRHREYNPAGANLRNVWTLAPEPFDAEFCTACQSYFEGAAKSAIRTRTVDGARRRICPCGRWDAWVSHFACFPTELARRCILAGTSAYGACPTCGAGWKRRIDQAPCDKAQRIADGEDWGPQNIVSARARHAGGFDKYSGVRTDHGWQPPCTCHDPRPLVPPIVLDPFSGSGTSVLVAHQLGRRALGLELNPDYAAMSRQRIVQDAPLLEPPAPDVWLQGALL